MRTIFGLLITALMATACKEKYSFPDAAVNKNYLVVEGFINAGQDSTFIQLSRTVTPQDSNHVKQESDALVSIRSNTGDVFQLIEILPGKYAAPPLALNISNTYQLFIETKDGKQYQSTPIEVKLSPPIDSVSWQRDAAGITIQANTHDPSKKSKYYIWNYEDVWEIHSAYTSSLIYDPTYKIAEQPTRTNRDSLFFCWKTEQSTSILLSSTAKLSDDIVYRFPLLQIEEGSWKLGVRYSILVKQKVLTPEAFDFLEKMKKNSESMGSIFDPQPSFISGNITCTTNPDESVIGFIYASSVVEKRIFISKADVPKWGYRFDCEEIKVLANSDSMRMAFQGGYNLITRFEQLEGYFYGASKYCTDCRARGVHEKPFFW